MHAQEARPWLDVSGGWAHDGRGMDFIEKVSLYHDHRSHLTGFGSPMRIEVRQVNVPFPDLHEALLNQLVL
jgi:hypothetical protein